KNILGIYPRGWRVPLEYRSAEGRKEILVRLMGVQAKEILDPNNKDKPAPPPPPDKKQGLKPPAPSPLAKFYNPKPGFSNYYFNEKVSEALLKGFRHHGDFPPLAGNWTISGGLAFKKLRNESPATIDIGEEKKEPVVRMKVGDFPYPPFYPLKDQAIEA